MSFCCSKLYYFSVTLKWKFEVSNMDYQFYRDLSYLMFYLMWYSCPVLIKVVLLEYTNLILN